MTAPVMAPMPAGDEPAAGRKKSGAARVWSVVSGIVIAVVLQLGMPPNDLKLFTAILVAAALSMPLIREKIRSRKARS